jgi:hypothetical protein
MAYDRMSSHHTLFGMEVKHTLSTVARDHLNLFLLQRFTQSVLFQVLDGPVNEFGDMIDSNHFSRRANKMVEHCTQVPRTASDVEDFRSWTKVRKEMLRCISVLERHQHAILLYATWLY